MFQVDIGSLVHAKPLCHLHLGHILLDSICKHRLAEVFPDQYSVGVSQGHSLFSPDFDKTPAFEIKSTGYVVDTLEAAVWCLMTTDNYKDCVLKAVNLGDDTDTVAAIACGLAGALYGYDSIPEEWRNTLIKREYIEELCERASKAWN